MPFFSINFAPNRNIFHSASDQIVIKKHIFLKVATMTLWYY